MSAANFDILTSSHLIYSHTKPHTLSSRDDHALSPTLLCNLSDDWSIMALKQLAGMSIIEFDPEHYPETVLDLGCGTGLWVIEAAKAWPVSTCPRPYILSPYRLSP